MKVKISLYYSTYSCELIINQPIKSHLMECDYGYQVATDRVYNSNLTIILSRV